MKELLWDGADPSDSVACPYPVDFEFKAAPAKTLNSLESGRLMMTVDLGSAEQIREVQVKITNITKRENLDKVQGNSKLKHKVVVSANLTQGAAGGVWTGEMSIPSSWMEGGTATYERTGSSTPKETANSFSMEITYILANGNRCTARFVSKDAFHWQSRASAVM